MVSHTRKVHFTNKNEVREFNKKDYPTNYITHPEKYTVMLGEMANANRAVERNMNSNNVRRITRKRANKWSPITAKRKAFKLARNLHGKKRSAKKVKKVKKLRI